MKETGEIKHDEKEKTGKDGPDNNDESIKIDTTDNIRPKKNKCMDSVEWVIKFHGRKY